MKFEPLLPWWGLLLIIGPLLVWLAWIVLQKLRGKTKRSLAWVLRAFGIVVCLVVIAIGPSFPGERAPAGIVNLDVVIVIDRTPSISAEDYDGTKPRLEGVKHDVLELITTLSGARIALVTFDNAASLNVPFTSDSTAAATAIRVMDQGMALYSKGSSIDAPIAMSVKLLNQSRERYPERGRLFFYVGDGEQTGEKAPQSFAAIKPLINGGAVLGYGTTAGGKMASYYGFQTTDDQAPKKYVQDMSDSALDGFVPAVSKIDETNLQKIASDTGVKYLHRTSLDQSMSDVVSASKLEVVADTHREVTRYVSLYWMFSLALVALLLWWWAELWSVVERGMRREGRS